MAETPQRNRTSAIIAAVTRYLEERRAMVDRADDLGQVQITVRLHPGTANVKSVTVSEERVVARSDR